MHHYCVVVADLEEAIRWYSEKLDFGEVERRFGFPEVGTEIAHLVNANGVRIELIAREGSEAGPDAERDVFGALLVRGSKHMGFLVEDVGAVAEELRRRGDGDRHGAERRRAGGGDQLLDQGPGRHPDRVRRVARRVGRTAALFTRLTGKRNSANSAFRGFSEVHIAPVLTPPCVSR
jgi:catechol 2,3-dioxygenase-like lactoylglutathione lyase family enzyme